MKAPWIKYPAWLAEVPPEKPKRTRRLLKEHQEEHRVAVSALEQSAAAETGALWRPDGIEVFERASPVTLALAADGIPEVDRAEAFVDALGYFFGGERGAHPADVALRIYDLAFELMPKMVGALVPPAVLPAVRGRMPAAHRWRVLAMIEGTRVAHRTADAHEEIIAATLRLAVARRADGGGDFRVMPIHRMHELLRLRENEELVEFEARLHALRGLLGFLFGDGGLPGDVTRRVYCLAKWRPSTSALLHDMTLHQLGLLFGEVRATWSWRVKNVINRMLEWRGAKGTQSGFQKSETACEAYAEAAAGNCNRRGGAALRAVG